MALVESTITGIAAVNHDRLWLDIDAAIGIDKYVGATHHITTLRLFFVEGTIGDDVNAARTVALAHDPGTLTPDQQDFEDRLSDLSDLANSNGDTWLANFATLRDDVQSIVDGWDAAGNTQRMAYTKQLATDCVAICNRAIKVAELFRYLVEDEVHANQ